MTNPTDLQNMIGRTAVDAQGNKIGKIGQIYLDDQTSEPTWVTVHTGLFGTKQTFAPLSGSQWDGDQIVLAVSADLVKDAPNVDADGHLEDDENERLYRHYAGSFSSAGQGDTFVQDSDVQDSDVQFAGSGRDDRSGDAGVVGHDTSGPTTDEAMTRSEERLRVGTEKVEAGRARLRKYIVTENVTTSVPVSHEEVRLEREPITDGNVGDAMAGGDITEEEHEVILHSERPIVTKETVPVERVRLATETVTEDQTVTEEVRKEQIDQVDVDSRTSTR